MKYIKDLAEGNNIRGIYFCKNKLSTETKNGKPYDSLILQDKSGTLDTKVWEPYSPGIGEYETGDYIEVAGDVITFAGAKQAKLTRIRKCQEGEYDPADYMPCTKKNIEEMYAQVMAYVNGTENTYLKQLLLSFFGDETLAKRFKNASAAKSVHHGFIGGLLEHTLSVTNLCNYYCGAYPMLKKDLLISAALLHDIGKIKEISGFPENDYTDEGQLLGHIVMGSEMITEHAKEILDFPSQLLGELKHCILSHHGELEYGSPKKPALIEAVALSFADNTDAKMETFAEVLENTESREWLGFNRYLETNLRMTGDL
ncbi:MAG TPA: HD domain-containing protein [Lachnospiraceae bacterium]|nr:HD domain-containing protein [Lachnospiraceae bacterium]